MPVACPVAVPAPAAFVPLTVMRLRVTPGMRPTDSPMEESGNCPMSSADTASTTPNESLLICRARWRDPRMPVTTISCRVLALCAVGRPGGATSPAPAAAVGGALCATGPAPSARDVPPAAAIRTARQRSDFATARSACGFGGKSAESPDRTLCACSGPLRPKVTDPNARPDRPIFDALRDARFNALRNDFRLIRHPLADNGLEMLRAGQPA